MKKISRFNALEARIQATLAQHSIPVTRFAVGNIFLWFGILKFFPGLSPAQDLAGRTIFTLTLGSISPQISVPVLATWECAIGIGLLIGTGWYIRATLVLLALLLPGTFLPLIFFPAETWTHFPFAPTLEGQYIIKNLALISAGLLIGGTMHGGKVITGPKANHQASRKQAAHSRYRRRFRIEP